MISFVRVCIFNNMIRFTSVNSGNKVRLIPANIAYLLPRDVWWKIFRYLWEDKNVQQFTRENPMVSQDLKSNKLGKGFTSDLFVLRRTCRLWRRVVEKYTKRYRSRLTRNYHLVLNYS